MEDWQRELELLANRDDGTGVAYDLASMTEAEQRAVLRTLRRLGMIDLEPTPSVDGEFDVDYGDTPPLLPDGTYQAKYLGHETQYFGKSPKVYLRFRILDPGNWNGTELFRAYTVKSFVGRPGAGGRFKATKHCLLFKMLCRVLALERRLDRLPLALLKSKVLTISTRTVRTDYRQAELPQFLWYSTVDDVLRIDASA